MTMLLLGLLPLWSEARSLGRLFFTPAQRQALELPQVKTAPEPGAAISLRLDGWFNDQAGKRWFWLNHRLCREDQPDYRPRLMGKGVALVWRGHTLVLRPGQTAWIDATGQLRIEGLADAK